jgi:hypothetical protein
MRDPARKSETLYRQFDPDSIAGLGPGAGKRKQAAIESFTGITKWIQNRVRMYRWPRPAEIRGSFYQAATDLDEVLAYFNARQGDLDALPESPDDIDGSCYICQQATCFRVERPANGGNINWRETLVCPGCGLMNRWRSSVHIFEQQVQPQAGDRVYITEAVTPLFEVMAKRHPDTVGSEYFAGAAPGAMIDTPAGPVRNEDVTALTFGDRSLHAVLSFDVLEHVPDYRAALKEFHRVLATGGQLILSVPFLFARQTRIRARLNGAGGVEHLCEPVYHGDPLSDEGVLCFYEFGTDLLQEIRNAGFRESFLICYVSRKWAYAESQVMFIGRKRS